MPKWLVDQTLKRLGTIDTQVKKGRIGEREHNERSRAAIERALAIQRNISIKYRCKYKK